MLGTYNVQANFIKGDTGLLSGLFHLVILMPSFALQPRKLHDIGKSGWVQIMPWAIFAVTWVLAFVTQTDALYGIGLIAAFASFVVLIVWLVRKGDEGPNKYGPDPRQETSQQPYKP